MKTQLLLGVTVATSSHSCMGVASGLSHRILHCTYRVEVEGKGATVIPQWSSCPECLIFWMGVCVCVCVSHCVWDKGGRAF